MVLGHLSGPLNGTNSKESNWGKFEFFPCAGMGYLAMCAHGHLFQTQGKMHIALYVRGLKYNR